ncbi:glycosyltransferase [Salinivibrio sharmensis]|uniref:Glycosyl transferase n=1 Tax=Salinivibrio sharmensis TaxID=390883 RepID=A0ABX3KHH9_9GAMM|nr:glycosyltransferase [Salinivibrio sharmensis]OOE88691.1 glycosyl transferase [Salinivibrio sharmensis]
MNFSVLMSVYKAEKPDFLQQAIESIYHNQTLKPSQVVIVKDGPLPEQIEAVLARYQSELQEILTIFSLPKNVGLGAALNAGLAHCRYELIARMDTDDIAMPERFAKQVKFMQENLNVIACSGVIEEWDSGLTEQLGCRKLPLEHNDIIRFAKSRSPLNHPAAMFRKVAVVELGGYPPLRKAQDYALWSLLIVNGSQLANLPNVLLKMRTGDEMMGRRGLDYFKHEYQLLQFQKNIGFFSYSEYIKNVVTKGLLRVSPLFIKRAAYNFLR